MTDAQKPLVLVVDDEPAILMLVCKTLEADYRTATATDGREGLDVARQLRPDCIISDLLMPELSGEEFLAEIRLDPDLTDVPVILVTGRDDPSLRATLLDSGAQDFLFKPFSAVELRARVNNWVQASRAKAALRGALDSRIHDLEALAREVITSRHSLQEALRETRRARDEAEQASQLKSDFLAMVSHEFRTPLTALQLQLRVLSGSEPTLMDRQAEIVRRMGGSLTRLQTLIESLLQYAAVESGGIVPESKKVDIVALCEDAIEEVEPQATQKGIGLECRIPATTTPLTSDRQLLRLVLVNLLANAVKFTDVGHVELGLECSESHHRLTVRDTGPGIAPADVGRIFQPFERLDETRRKHVPGVGLGLALVQDMVALLGGRIELESEPEQGSAFTIVLPTSAD